uniref:Uncharacterized protein n=1 Tax=Arundo donax TaxID=35708 RepID=A0A0A9D0P1_ARUDO
MAPAAATTARSPAAATSSPRASARPPSLVPPRSAKGSRSRRRSASATASRTSPRRKRMKCMSSQQVRSVCRLNSLGRTKFRTSSRTSMTCPVHQFPTWE